MMRRRIKAHAIGVQVVAACYAADSAQSTVDTPGIEQGDAGPASLARGGGTAASSRIMQTISIAQHETWDRSFSAVPGAMPSLYAAEPPPHRSAGGVG